ncbi:MAG: hypothetical protein PHG08_00195 [Bacilli bacterium]|nr:hypothetical protein [Bacilli bacterium]
MAAPTVYESSLLAGGLSRPPSEILAVKIEDLDLRSIVAYASVPAIPLDVAGVFRVGAELYGADGLGTVAHAGSILEYENTVVVDIAGANGKYSSIKTAIDDITTNTSINPITVLVYPGLYVEDIITLKPYVSLVSVAGANHTIIQVNATNKVVVNGVNYSSIDGFSITGSEAAEGIYFSSTTNTFGSGFELKNIKFFGNLIDLYLEGSTYLTHTKGDNLYFTEINNITTNHILITNTGGGEMISVLDNVHIEGVDGFGTALTEAVLVTGADNIAQFNGIILNTIGGSNNGADGLVVEDGARLDVIGGSVTNFNNNIVAKNSGTAPILNVSGTTTKDSTLKDLLVEHAGTTGYFDGSASETKITIDAASSFKLEALGGKLRYNNTNNYVEVYNGTYWSRLGMIKQSFNGDIVQSSNTTLIAVNNVAPIITDGTQLWSQAITPLSTANKIDIDFSIMVDSGTSNRGVSVALFNGSTLLDVKTAWIAASGAIQTISMRYTDLPASVSEQTYSARIGISSTATWYCNKGASATFGAGIKSTYTVEEKTPL